MANRRVLVKRRKSVKNIRKITRTMQLIATARFQSTHGRAVASRPYSDKLGELVSDLSRAAGGEADHPLMRRTETPKRSVLVVITSNRGFCGAYNANILRLATSFLDSRQDSEEAEVYMVGRKGVSYFRFIGRDTERQITNLGENPRFEEVEPIGNELMRRFTDGEIDAVHVAYMRFESTSRQEPTVAQLLPLQALDDTSSDEAVADDTSETATATTSIEYEFSPAPKELLDALLPASVRMRLFQAFLDAVVSEHVARMVAMKAATDSAGDMIKTLTREYNRARQTHITMELLDILGGVNALEG
ncbi:MAG: ATP synthase F1 subunit gamma [Acidobacteriota bacterium]